MLGVAVDRPRAGLLDLDDVLVAVGVAVHDDHPQRRLERLPARARTAPPSNQRAWSPLVLEDQHLVGRRFQQRVLGGLHRVGVADLAGRLDAVAAAASRSDASQPLLGLLARLVDVAERVRKDVRLDRRHDDSHLDALAVAERGGSPRPARRLERVGDDRQQAVDVDSAPRSLVGRDRLVGLAVLGLLALLGGGGVAVGEAVLVAVAGDVDQVLLGQLEALGLALAGLDQRLLGGVVVSVGASPPISAASRRPPRPPPRRAPRRVRPC